MNTVLADIRASIVEKYRDLKSKTIELTPLALRDAFLGLGIKRHTLLEMFFKLKDDMLKMADAGMVTRKTYTRYALTYKRLEDFLRHIYHTQDMDFRNIGLPFIQDFEFYLLTVCKLSHNTASKPLKYLKKVIRQTQCSDLLQSDPFHSFKIKTEKTDRE